MVQDITSNGLLGLPHFRNSRISMGLMEPIYKNLFTVQITLPKALGYDDAATNLFLEEVSKVDGLSVAFADWRFNLRKSNTEPLIRLNVEARGDRQLMQEKTQELLAIINDCQNLGSL